MGINKIPGKDSILALSYRLLIPGGMVVVQTRNNYRLYVNSSDVGIARPLIINKVFEPYQTELHKEIIRKSDTVIDIGANIGYFTILDSLLVGEKGKIYAFEPEKEIYDILIKNLTLNNCRNISTFNLACSNKNGYQDLFTDKYNLGNFSFAAKNVIKALNSPSKIRVETVKLDDFFENKVKASKIDFVKIDTEGAEELVIQGLDKILRANNGIKLMMEFWPTAIFNVGSNPDRLLLDLENKYGFKLYLLDEEKHTLKLLNSFEILKYAKSMGDNFSCELLVTRDSYVKGK